MPRGIVGNADAKIRGCISQGRIDKMGKAVGLKVFMAYIGPCKAQKNKAYSKRGCVLQWLC